MDLRGPFESRFARRRWIAAGAVAVASLAAGAMVAASHGHDSGPPHRTAATAVKAIPPVHNPVPRRGPVGWRRHPGPVPILMYHVIERARPGVRNPLLYVRRRTFAAEMRWLERHGFQAVTLDQVEDGWTHDAPLPRRPIVISFDDGYRSHYTTAMPILRRHGWPGVLSLTLGNINEPGDPLTPARVQKLIQAGWELASHTVSHLDLRGLGRRRLRREVRDSRRILRYVFQVPVDNFTYPAGRYDRRTVAAVRAAGYRGALTVAPGLASRRHPFELKRIRMTQDMRVRGLARELKALGV